MSERISVVIADDHPLFRKGLREVIDGDTMITTLGEADNGESALELLRTLAPAIAILDINMPRMSGLAVARALVNDTSGVDIIFLTMYNEDDLFNEAMDAGARGYVLKDSAVNDILSAIHTVAGGRYYISPALSDLLMKRSARVEKLLRHTPSLEDLTPAELRVLKLVAGNKTSKEIAETLFISTKTVENHRTNIAAKLHLKGSHSLLKFALENKEVLRI
jgi:DNA-binding NarL/FixJ family response regulator